MTDDNPPTTPAPDTAAAADSPSSGIIRTAGAHAPVLDEATPDITDEGAADITDRTFADYGVEPEICLALAARGITSLKLKNKNCHSLRVDFHPRNPLDAVALSGSAPR